MKSWPLAIGKFELLRFLFVPLTDQFKRARQQGTRASRHVKTPCPLMRLLSINCVVMLDIGKIEAAFCQYELTAALALLRNIKNHADLERYRDAGVLLEGR